MTVKSKCTSACFFLASSVISAQSFTTTHQRNPDATDTIRQLEQNALLALIAAVVLIAVGWLCYICKACTGLNKSHGSSRKPFLSFLVLAAGLSTFCSSCSVEQQAMAARNQAMEETRSCPMNQHQSNQTYNAYKNRYPSNSYSNWQGPTFCRYCGKRLPDGY